MRAPARRRLVTVLMCATIALGAALPSQARSEWLNLNEPRWLDQTVYRPNCPLVDCACDCRADLLCLPGCVRW